jgi:flagellar protein FlaG
MVTEIQARTGITQLSVSQTDRALNTKTPQEEVPKVELPPLVRPEIKVDLDKMRSNLQDALTKINDMMVDGGRNLGFSIDPALSQPVIIVRKLDTGEVIRQIPNEVVVSIAHNIENLKGVLLNRKV